MHHGVRPLERRSAHRFALVSTTPRYRPLRRTSGLARCRLHLHNGRHGSRINADVSCEAERHEVGNGRSVQELDECSTVAQKEIVSCSNLLVEHVIEQCSAASVDSVIARAMEGEHREDLPGDVTTLTEPSNGAVGEVGKPKREGERLRVLLDLACQPSSHDAAHRTGSNGEHHGPVDLSHDFAEFTFERCIREHSLVRRDAEAEFTLQYFPTIVVEDLAHEEEGADHRLEECPPRPWGCTIERDDDPTCAAHEVSEWTTRLEGSDARSSLNCSSDMGEDLGRVTSERRSDHEGTGSEPDSVMSGDSNDRYVGSGAQPRLDGIECEAERTTCDEVDGAWNLFEVQRADGAALIRQSLPGRTEVGPTPEGINGVD